MRYSAQEYRWHDSIHDLLTSKSVAALNPRVAGPMIPTRVGPLIMRSITVVLRPPPPRLPHILQRSKNLKQIILHICPQRNHSPSVTIPRSQIAWRCWSNAKSANYFIQGIYTHPLHIKSPKVNDQTSGAGNCGFKNFPGKRSIVELRRGQV